MNENKGSMDLKFFALFIVLFGLLSIIIMSLSIITTSIMWIRVGSQYLPYLMGLLIVYGSMYGLGELISVLNRISNSLNKE